MALGCRGWWRGRCCDYVALATAGGPRGRGEARSVRVLAVGKAVRAECGPVTLQPEHMQRLAPDGNWLRRRMAQALGLAAAPPWPVVSGQVWRLGDIGHASARRRILYGERLARPETLRALHAVWPSLVGEVPTILLTTTSPERVFCPGCRCRSCLSARRSGSVGQA